MHKHVMWAVCDVSVVQPHLHFGLFGWGHATLKTVPMNALLSIKGRVYDMAQTHRHVMYRVASFCCSKTA